MNISEIDPDIAVDFVRTHHYSKVLPRLTKKYLGVIDGGELVGVVTLGWGTQPLQTIQKIFPKHELVSADYLEIGKMCFLPRLNKSNSGSRIMSMLVSWLRANSDIEFLYTLADGIMGKCGYVYQASNFRYLGSFPTAVCRDRATGEKVHPRSARKLCEENAEWEGREKVFWLTHDFCEHKGLDKITGLMFRYIYPLGKPGKKILASYPEYDRLKNPKDADLLFRRRTGKGKSEPIPMPDFNMNVSVHNFQKW